MRGSLLLSSRFRTIGSCSSSVVSRSRTLQKLRNDSFLEGSLSERSLFIVSQEKYNIYSFHDNAGSRSFTSTNDSPVSNTDLQQTIDHAYLRQHGDSNDEWKQAIIEHAEAGDSKKAQEILLHQQSLALSSDKLNCLPDFDSYTSVLDSWVSYQHDLMSSSSDEVEDTQEKRVQMMKELIDAADQADLILKNMEDTFGIISSSKQKHELDDIRPTSHHYDAVINAWYNVASAYQEHKMRKKEQGSSNNKDSEGEGIFVYHRGVPQRAQLRLEAMENISQSNYLTYTNVRPSIGTYNRVMEIWGMMRDKEHHFASMAQNIFDRLAPFNAGSTEGLIQPNSDTYRIMIRTWCRSTQKGAAFNATGFLMKMQSLLIDGIEEMEPSVEDYAMVLEAWTKADDKYAVRRAQSVLRKMDGLRKDGISEVVPNIECFKHVLNTMAKSNLVSDNIGQLADNLMKRMVNEYYLLPDGDCFGAVIETWSHSARLLTEPIQRDTAARKAHEWLMKMERMYHQSSSVFIRPETKNYNSVIRAWSVCHKLQEATEKAEMCMKKMEELDDETEDALRRRPNRDSFLYMIQTWGNSHTKEQGQKAVELLNRMLEQYNEKENASCSPTTEIFNMVVKACAYTKYQTNEERKEALQLAFQTIYKMRTNSSCEITPQTYCMLLKAVGNLLQEGRQEKTKMLVSLFENCCMAGLVDQNVVTQFKENVPDEIYRKMIILRTDKNSLPEDWTRNVRQSYGVTSSKVDNSSLARINHNGSRTVSIDGLNLVLPCTSEHKMKKLRSKVNQRLLRGGRSP